MIYISARRIHALEIPVARKGEDDTHAHTAAPGSVDDDLVKVRSVVLRPQESVKLDIHRMVGS